MHRLRAWAQPLVSPSSSTPTNYITRRCLPAIHGQHYANYEVVLVDRRPTAASLALDHFEIFALSVR
jgi:hypothetical protein